MRLNLSIGALVALQLAFGLALQLVVIAIVGLGPSTDAFVAAQAVPLAVFAILSASLQNAWLPVLSAASANPPAWVAEQNIAQGQTLLMFGLTCGVLAASAPWWITKLFPGILADQQTILIKMTRLLLLGAFFNGHAAMLNTAQRARGRFLSTEAVMLTASVLAVPAVWWLVPQFGIEAAAWVALGRAALACVALYLLADRPRLAAVSGYRRTHVWRQMGPVLGSSSLYKSGPLVDRYWSSQAGPGGMTVFSLAQTAIGALATIIERATCMPLASRMGHLVALQDISAVRRQYRGCVWRVTLAALVVALGFILVQAVWAPIVGLVFKVDSAAAHELWVACVLLLGYLHVAASGTIVVAAFYAMGDTKTPSVTLAGGFLLGVALKSAGFVMWGIKGLAAATSAYHLVNLVLLCVVLERRLTAHLLTSERM